MVESVLQLRCSCNNYPWGKRGKESLAARLCAKTPNNPDFKLDPSKDYAEMWLGTYPDLPSYVLSSGENLQDVLDANKEQLIGEKVLSKFNGDSNLPFLPKVLSIAKALPLQLHPDKELSSKLHKEDPQNFTDPNHKPEIALALGDFEAFVGFKPLKDIQRLLELEPLQRFRPAAQSKEFDDKGLKAVVKAMLEANEDVVAETGARLRKLGVKAFAEEDGYIVDMLPRLWEQYDKTDPGTLVALITMNYLKLKAGESIYIPADGIHAYLSGDIIECMARSNNVLNTGFCPSADRNSVDLFCSVLTFTPHTAQESILKPQKFSGSENGFTQIFAPPMSEFDMLEVKLPAGEKEKLRALKGPSVFINVEGNGRVEAEGKSYDLQEGFIFFVGQGTELVFEAESGLKVYTAFVE